MLSLLPLLALSIQCSECHPQESLAWSRSSHASAFARASFQASWARGGRDPWCKSCHAPAGGAGIGCESCHGEQARGCKACHEFAFPAPRASFTEPVRALPVMMQSTFSERDEAGAASCTSCHMKRGDHSVPGVALAKEALVVRAHLEAGALVVELEVKGAGHAVPTGDPFRRLRVSTCADAACALALDAEELGRVFKKRGELLEELRDTRPRPGRPARVRFADPGPHWRVELILSEPGLAVDKLLIRQGALEGS